ncbi:hypothetical protein QBC47DRAFT_394434 [Echria macrotheca]|uniref:Ribosomal RNA-processing protein 40 n=1 Tax=Echria macrotheca TaxID=438768 RepID=A0AAJ0B266_9PEZI|nr:hypothetical protein QBC47DRAFT_394434 [Echria macrotheca]
MAATDRIIVLPGDTIDPAVIPTPRRNAIRLGPGLRHVQATNSIVPTVAGQLITDHGKGSMWVESSTGHYIPAISDLVIGQITRSQGDYYLVNLSPYTPNATLPHLSFEAATKKTRPQLNPGALVYARVTLANRHMDPELECVSQTTGKGDGLGPLTGGMVFDVSLGMARRLLLSKPREYGGVAVLELLADEGLAFETAVGRNGKVWVGSDKSEANTRMVIAVGRALRETDERGLDVEAQKKLVRRIMKELSR